MPRRLLPLMPARNSYPLSGDVFLPAVLRPLFADGATDDIG
jgi:hypothetical protein